MNNTKISTVKCVVNNCDSKMSQNQDYSFFTFPKNDPIRCAKWIENCGLSISIDDVIKKRYSVCGKHFAQNMFLNDLKNRLQPHAIPVLFIDTTHGLLPRQINFENTISTPTKASTSSIVEVLASQLDKDDSSNGVNLDPPSSTEQDPPRLLVTSALHTNDVFDDVHLNLTPSSSFDSYRSCSSSSKSVQTLKSWSNKTPRKNLLREQLNIEREARRKAEKTVLHLSNQLSEYDTVEHFLNACEKHLSPTVLAIVKSHMHTCSEMALWDHNYVIPSSHKEVVCFPNFHLLDHNYVEQMPIVQNGLDQEKNREVEDGSVQGEDEEEDSVADVVFKEPETYKILPGVRLNSTFYVDNLGYKYYKKRLHVNKVTLICERQRIRNRKMCYGSASISKNQLDNRISIVIPHNHEPEIISNNKIQLVKGVLISHPLQFEISI